MGCVCLIVVEELEEEFQNQLSDDAIVLVTGIITIKEAIMEALKRGFSVIDVYSDSRSALKALNKPSASAHGRLLRSRTLQSNTV